MRLRWLLLAYPLIEIAAALVLAQWIGWPLTLVLIAIGIPIGWILTKRAGYRALHESSLAMRSGVLPTTADFGQFIAGILIMIPGLISSLAGTILLIPGVRARLWNNGIPRASGPTIQGNVVQHRDDSGGFGQRDLMQ